MRCYVVLDKQGKIVSTGYIDQPELETFGKQPELEAEEYVALRAGPVTEVGETVVELDVPREHLRMPPTDLVERLQVEIQTARPRMKRRKK